jgi:hypothetical protein
LFPRVHFVLVCWWLLFSSSRVFCFLLFSFAFVLFGLFFCFHSGAPDAQGAAPHRGSAARRAATGVQQRGVSREAAARHSRRQSSGEHPDKGNAAGSCTAPATHTMPQRALRSREHTTHRGARTEPEPTATLSPAATCLSSSSLWRTTAAGLWRGRVCVRACACRRAKPLALAAPAPSLAAASAAPLPPPAAAHRTHAALTHLGTTLCRRRRRATCAGPRPPAACRLRATGARRLQQRAQLPCRLRETRATPLRRRGAGTAAAPHARLALVLGLILN